MVIEYIRAVLVLLILIVISLGSIVTAINGVEISTAIEMTLHIDSYSGSRNYEDITTLNLSQKRYIQFKLLKVEVQGDINSIAISGKATLRSSSGKEIEVDMPCIYTYNASCFRISMVIPGYDTSLLLPSEVYTVSINLTWSEALGKGNIIIHLAIESSNNMYRPPSPATTFVKLNTTTTPSLGTTPMPTAIPGPPPIIIEETTVTRTITETSTITMSMPITVLSTIMSTEIITIIVTKWTTTIVLAIVVLIIGFAIGYLVKRR